jgi:hypothetical protein
MDGFQRVTSAMLILLAFTCYAQGSGCCALFSYQIEAFQLQAYYGPNATAGASVNRFLVAYDLQPGQLKAFVNLTARNTRGETINENALFDYTDNKFYAFDSKSCKMLAPVGLKMDACVPDNAKSLGTFSLGGVLNFTAYSLKEAGTVDQYTWEVSAETLVESGSCYPIFTAGIYVGYNTTVGLSTEQYAATATFQYHSSAVKSFDVFNPPDICNKTESGDKESNIEPSLLAKILYDTGSFNVFKVLTRLAAATEILKNN